MGKTKDLAHGILRKPRPIWCQVGGSWQYKHVAGLPDDVRNRLKRDDSGLFPAVIQDCESHRVLMVGYMNDEALSRTISEGRVTFWSRSRRCFWRKGDTSGHYQYLRGIEIDCDGDALLLQVHQQGVACHTGSYSCFDAGGNIDAARTDVCPHSGSHLESHLENQAQPRVPPQQNQRGEPC